MFGIRGAEGCIASQYLRQIMMRALGRASCCKRSRDPNVLWVREQNCVEISVYHPLVNQLQNWGRVNFVEAGEQIANADGWLIFQRSEYASSHSPVRLRIARGAC